MRSIAPLTAKLSTSANWNLILEQCHNFLLVFSEIAAQEHPPHRPYDHSILLKKGFNPPFGPIYSLPQVELEALKVWLEENLSKGFIHSSLSLAGAPVLFIKKTGDGLCLCADYCGLNECTIKKRYPLALLRETHLHLQKDKYYMKLDVRGI